MKKATFETNGQNTPLSDAIVDKTISTMPLWMQSYLEKLKPLFYVIGDIIDKSSPLFYLLYDISLQGYQYYIQYHLHEYIPLFVGFFMMLFGGYFMVTIACIEAVRICGWEQFKVAFISLYEDMMVVKEASAKDDTLDENDDGIPDVQQINKKELLTRKIKVFARACNPVKLSDALTGIYSGALAVFSILQMQFARTVALGAAIGDVVFPWALHFVEPVVQYLIDKPYHKWIPVVLGYVCKCVGVFIAITVSRILAAFHSALRGASIFTHHFAIITKRHGYIDLSEGYWDEAFCALLCIVGLYIQLLSWFSLSWYLGIPLFPFVIVENTLNALMAYQAF